MGKQTVRRHLDRYEGGQYPDRSGRPDRIFIGQCETILVQGPETGGGGVSGGGVSGVSGGGVFIIPAYLYWRRSIVKAGAAVGRV